MLKIREAKGNMSTSDLLAYVWEALELLEYDERFNQEGVDDVNYAMALLEEDIKGLGNE